MFDYARYENATKKELFSALLLTEKKAEKLALQVKENKKIARFLKSKIKQSLNKSTKQSKTERKKMQDEPTKETLLALKNARSLPKYTSHEQLVEELQTEINEKFRY